jgi:CRP/FNR family transcriptional regulator, cyclic AMP receptor protein
MTVRHRTVSDSGPVLPRRGVSCVRVNPLRVNVLDEDPELGELLGGKRNDAARAASNAGLLQIPIGGWNAIADAPRQGQGGFGLLILDGLVVRRVGFDGRWGAELLGPGDLLRPWEGDEETMGAATPFETYWRVMNPLRLAVLDLSWAARMSGYPQIGGELTGRALKRARRLVMSMAIVQVPRLDDRLWMIFWELAERWGRVHRDGVHLELPLTHELLSHLAAARRPSVSGALTRLGESGRVVRVGRSWVLAGEPPEPPRAAGAQPSVATASD